MKFTIAIALLIASTSAKRLKDIGATGLASYSNHAVLDDVLHADRRNKIQSVAGPDVTN
jgi:hypothetical protein